MSRIQPEQWNLKRLTSELAHHKAGASVWFDFASLKPTGLISYRGYYDHLSFTFDEAGHAPTAQAVLGWLVEANGKTFIGYKGGDFVMHDGTPIWVANRGNAGGTAVVGVTTRYDGSYVYIETAVID